MEKIVSYLTQNAASALGVTILTGLTVSSSAVGATKIVQSIQVKKPNAAIVKNHVVELPEQASDRAKTVILAKFGSSTITPTKKVTSPTPTIIGTTQSIAQNQNANKCIVTLFGKQYDVTPLKTGHPGGNIFSCGTDMTAIYQAQHGTNLSRVAEYLITDPATSEGSVTPSPSVTGSQDRDDDDDKFEDEKEEMEERHEREKKAFEKRRESEKKEHEIDDDFEEED